MAETWAPEGTWSGSFAAIRTSGVRSEALVDLAARALLRPERGQIELQRVERLRAVRGEITSHTQLGITS
jgi:hypothetical protein